MKIKDLIDMIELDGWQQVRQKAAIVNLTIPSHQSQYGHNFGQTQRGRSTRNAC